MALCTLYSAIEVSGAGNETFNGIYYPAGETAVGLQAYTKDGNINSWPKLYRPSGSGWALNSNVPFPGAPSYFESTDRTQDCPPLDASWSVGAFGLGPAPTVTEYISTPSQPTFGLPAETVALITSRFGTVANFLRLRNQGQV